MKNNKKMSRKSKIEKRRLAFEKRNVKKEQNLARYGAEGGSALVMAKTTEFNRRVIAVVLALVFVLTTIVVGYNFAAKADDSDDGFKMYESIDDSGFVTRKGIRHNLGANQDDTSDDTYDLRLEAYATEQIATKTIDASKTPLDVVLVMDESRSMETEKDVWTGGYTEVNGPFNIKDAEGKYYRVGDNYYPVHYELEGYAEVQENGTNSVKNSWTAVQANQYFSQLSQQGRGLYYGSAHNSVYAAKTKTYPLRSDQTIDMGASYMNHSYLTGHYYSTDFYVYVPHDASEVDGAHSCWHRIYYREDGYTGDGYYYTFYYYTNSEEGSGASFSNGSAGDLKGSGSSQVRLLTDYHACATWGTRVGIYFEKDGYIKYWDNDVANGTDGNIYEKSSRDSDSLNYLYTVDEVLACPEPNSNYSHFYEGPLCTDGYRLFYQTDPDDDSTKQYVGSSVYKLTDGEAYNDSLYEKSYITRTKAQQLAATELAQKIAETSTEGKDHYIAVVGSKGSDAVKTNLVEANDNDNEPDNSVNDIIDTALDSLTSDGGSIAMGLVNAQSVFANKTLDPADSRKRIVVVFTDTGNLPPMRTVITLILNTKP